jgi:hypothetical protein
MGNKSNRSNKESSQARALARWEWEGGSTGLDRRKRAVLTLDEEHVLRCLGAAVIMRWNNLSTEIQRELITSAASPSDPLPIAQLKEQIARFRGGHNALGRRRCESR